jgi:phosphoribosylanthranilate isomerase
MVKVKICGITNLQDALASVKSGCDALGFIFCRKSPRYITAQKAKDIIAHLPRKVIKVGVFVNTPERRIKHIAKLCRLDILQFHGDESAEFCKKFKGYKIIKAFRVKDRMDLKKIIGYKTFGYLFDTFSPSRFGGTGKSFNWKLIEDLHTVTNQPIFLSGGLNLGNVKLAIKHIHPDWVDVSSSVELAPGKKDPKKVNRFIKAVRE